MKISQNGVLIAAIIVAAVAAGFSAGRSSLVASPGGQSQIEAMAVDFYNEGRTSQAFSMFRKLAKKGDTGAAYYLGEMYETGDGVPADGDKAVKWLTIAAKAGNSRAARQLGLLYLDGVVEVQDFARARKWLEIAAHAGDQLALRSLGDMNAEGFGAPADPVAAYAYYSVAALRGNNYAAAMRDRLAKKLDAMQQRDGERQAQQIQQRIVAPPAVLKRPAADASGAGPTNPAIHPAAPKTASKTS
ncbi:MAG: hypothetical protein Kow0026_12540 [Oricola sp.]